MLILTSLGVKAQETKIQWMEFSDAIEACKQHPKKIFIDVYTDWCGWCKRMDKETFSNEVIARYMNEHYYAVKFNAERMDTIAFAGYTFVNTPRTDGRRGTHQLAAALLNGEMSYPSYVVMNEEMKVIQAIHGYQPANDFEPMLHYFAEDAFKTTEWQKFMETFKSEISEQ